MGVKLGLLTLRENAGYRLRVFENKVLRRIFGPKRDEVTGEWIKLHNEELRDLYSSPSGGEERVGGGTNMKTKTQTGK
jgi:hypothetical protein